MEAEICEPALSMKAGWTWSEPRVIGCGASRPVRVGCPVCYTHSWSLVCCSCRRPRHTGSKYSKREGIAIEAQRRYFDTAWILLEYCLNTAWILLGYCLGTAGYQELSSIAIAMAYQGSRNIILNLRETENYNNVKISPIAADRWFNKPSQVAKVNTDHHLGLSTLVPIPARRLICSDCSFIVFHQSDTILVDTPCSISPPIVSLFDYLKARP